MEIALVVPPPQSPDGDNVTSTGNGSVDGFKVSSFSAASSSLLSTPLDSTANGLNALSSVKYDDDDEEGDMCWICRNPGNTENPLRYPCACSGSIKFVHQDSFLQWLNHSNARHCEVYKSLGMKCSEQVLAAFWHSIVMKKCLNTKPQVYDFSEDEVNTETESEDDAERVPEVKPKYVQHCVSSGSPETSSPAALYMVLIISTQLVFIVLEL